MTTRKEVRTRCNAGRPALRARPRKREGRVLDKKSVGGEIWLATGPRLRTRTPRSRVDREKVQYLVR